jgi:flagellar motor switch protein FliN/FliY
MSGDAGVMGHAEIEEMLKQAGGAASPVPLTAPAGGSGSKGSTPAKEAEVAQTSSTAAGDDIQYLLEQAEAAIASVNQPNPLPPELAAYPFRELSAAPASQEKATLEALSDVELDLKIELGRTQMHLEDVLKLRRGSVVTLDKLAGDPVDVYVNGRLIARGEVLVLNDNFCVRVAELVSGDDTD